MNAYLEGLLRSFDFSGRTGRGSYWLYYLVMTLIALLAIAVDVLLYLNGFDHQVVGAATAIVGILHMPAGISITVRRLHDVGHSGWWWLLNFVPFGGLVILFWTLCGSNPGSNDYGEPSGGRSPRRSAAEPYYARALRPSGAALARPQARARGEGSRERFI